MDTSERETWTAVHRGTKRDIERGEDYYRIGPDIDVSDPDARCIHVYGPDKERRAHLAAAAPEMDEVLGDVLPLLDEIAEKFGLSFSEAQGLADEVRRVRAKARGAAQ